MSELGYLAEYGNLIICIGLLLYLVLYTYLCYEYIDNNDDDFYE